MINLLENRLLRKSALIVLVSLLVTWVFYGLFGSRILLAMYESPSSRIANRFMPGRSITPFDNYLRRADDSLLRTSLTLVAVPFAIFLLKRPALPIVGCIAVVLIFLITFGSIEVFPSILDTIHLDGIGYYAYKRIFVPDPDLVFRSKPFLHTDTDGKSWVTDEDGFRNSNAKPFADLVIVGDGMVNSGRNWEDTFGKRLEDHLPGWSVRNLGMGGYGPFQYVEVLRRYGLKRKPQWAIFAFNEGNDIADIAKYARWRSGYPDTTDPYDAGITSLSAKLATTSSQTVTFLRGKGWEAAETVLATVFHHRVNGRLPRDRDAVVTLPNGYTFEMEFIDTQQAEPAEAIMATENWKHLEGLLHTFKMICAEHGVRPVVMLMPTAGHIYAQYSTDKGGPGWIQIREEQIRAKTNLEVALARLSAQVRIPFITLSSVFESAAKNGQQVYDSFSVHMNSEGAELAAQYVAEELQALNRRPAEGNSHLADGQ